MGDCDSTIPIPTYDEYEREKHVIAAARHIVKALAASSSVSNDLRKILVDLDTHLSTMTKLTEREMGRTREVEDRLISAQEKVISWQLNGSMIWDSGPHEASTYLQAVDELRRLAESLKSFLSNRNGKERELLDRAHSVLQMAMVKLEEELIYILTHNKLSFEPGCMSSRSYEENVTSVESVISTEDCYVEETSHRESRGTESEEYITDLVHPDVISDIKSIANVMFASSYDREFCEAFISFWKDESEEYLSILGVDKLSIEDALKMDLKSFNRRTQKWCQAMKIIIRSFLASEKRLFVQVLGNFESISSTCFLEASKAPMLCLLNFGEAIAISSSQPERLFCVIDMYEVLASLLQDIDALLVEEDGCFLRNEFHNLLKSLGDSVKGIFVEFKNQIASSKSATPFPKGGVHHVTKYVMNYIKALARYGDTLNLLLEVGRDKEDFDPLVDDDENTQNVTYNISCPVARRLRLVASILETNLSQKSNLYKNCSLKHIFMMNNIHYMVQKVGHPELLAYFGNEWLRKQTGKFQNHARRYERETWSRILSLLEQNETAGVKERFRSFNIAFEEVYKTQSEWFVQDLQLQKDLQISVSQKVILAYHTFVGRNSTSIRDKHIKYTTDDLEKYIMDLFQGSQRSLHNFWRL